MDKAIYGLCFLLSACFAMTACNQGGASPKTVAKKYCSSCHLFPDPALLDKITWKKNVLPAMGKLLGAQQPDIYPFEESDRIMSREKSFVSPDDWQKIITYYTSNAPDQMPGQQRSAIKEITSQFVVEKKNTGRIPSNTFLKIDSVNHWIYAAFMDSSLIIFDNQLNMVGRNMMDGILVDMFFDKKPDHQNFGGGVLTDIGIMHPNDLKTGSGSVFVLGKNGMLDRKKIIDTLPRPVQIMSADLDVDGRMDYLICGFGNKEGEFFWMRNTGDERFEHKMLRPLPGAIKAYIDDVNKDGLPDIIALFAQGVEGIYMFLNRGQGKFETKQLLRFSPVYGSTFFEMVDFNGDGKKDIIYTCGDNADYSTVLKNYHGIYIYLDQGNLDFKQQFFFPLHGAFKAVTKDFDKDGDLDIAAISYFPDKKNQPMEGFVFLEQSAGFQFVPYSIAEHSEGHWITMDAGDVDGDGDDDIVIGSLFLPNEALHSPQKMVTKPSFLLLRNRLK